MKKNRNILFKCFIITTLLMVLFWAPFIFLLIKTDRFIIQDIDQIKQRDAGIIFGAHITRDDHLTPILKERVEGGIYLWKQKKVDLLVVSNMPRAARVMGQYLVKQQIPKQYIEIDPRAKSTPDSCRFEKSRYPRGRRLIFLSQGYHLPRLIYQCKKLGIKGIGFPVEKLDIIDRTKTALPLRYFIRGKRYFREAALVWLAILDIYH